MLDRADHPDVALQRRLELALEAGQLGTWEYDLVRGRVHWSPQIERFHGIPEGSFEGTFEAYQRDIHPDDRERVLSEIQRNLQEGREHKLLYRIVRPDGETRWLEASGAFMRDEGGRPLRLIGVCGDVTDRETQRIAHHAKLMEQLVEGIGDSFSIISPDFRILFANRASAAQLGSTPAELMGKHVFDVAPQTKGTRFYSEIVRVMKTAEPIVFEEYYAPFERWFEVHAYPLTGTGVAVYSRDITTRHDAQALQARLLRYGELQGDVSEALASASDLRAILRRCCEAVVQRLGMAFARIWLLESAGEYLSLEASAGMYTHTDGGHARVRVGALKIGLIAAERKPHLSNDVQHDPRVGDHAWATREGLTSFAGYPLVVDDRLVGVMAAFSRNKLHDDALDALGGIAQSIAQGIERRRAELALEHKARELERSNTELEQFAYVASHDLQEPLRMVASYVQLLERRYRNRLDDDARDFIGYAVEGVTRMRNLIDDLLSYSRVGRHGAQLAPVKLDLVLAHALQNLREAIAESNAEITWDVLPEVMGDPSQLAQVFQNLIGNAVKFRQGDGVQIHVGLTRDGDDWLVSVRDNGIGIEPEYFDRIFVIFQRLNPREMYPGTGIGLAITKKIVERHGGRIRVDSAVGRGTTISFTLPTLPPGQESQ